ncbi:hypothetical protein METH_04975 [Leisingera methylohalidivorans DSM 14336]|uniref:Uncharacterized protein n=1 Tax=Leisingera methylohalidivorans DSM 14336 TaxID=999552 RepID=V9VZU4_9RHOB|nr:hypothetical protein METH_04975 [Leisingera methylohalidivorans DSM 14336]
MFTRERIARFSSKAKGNFRRAGDFLLRCLAATGQAGRQIVRPLGAGADNWRRPGRGGRTGVLHSSGAA